MPRRAKRKVRAYTAIGWRIAALAKNQHALAKVLGVSQQTVSKKLRGECAILLADLETLSKAYKVPTTYFFEEGDDAPEFAANWERVRKAPGPVRELMSLACNLPAPKVKGLLKTAKALTAGTGK